MSLILLLFLGANAGPMRCGDVLVAPGATTLDVVSKCGEPDLRERVSGADQPVQETWIYADADIGAQKLLHFEGVTLAGIANAGSGKWSRDQTGTFRCGDVAIQPGDTKLDVRKSCGEPGAARRVSLRDEALREVWLYERDQGVVELEFEGVELRRVERKIR